MKNAADITDWVKTEVGCRGSIDDTTSLQGMGVFGDDMGDFVSAYSARFDVNMDKYRWYFHTGEEGWNSGALFVRPPYRRITQIPITVGMLRGFANSGEWSVDYPQHQVPEKRVDLLINQMLTLVVAVGVVALLAWKYLG